METVKDRLKKVMDALELKPLTPASTCNGITKNMMYKLWQSETGAVSSKILEPFCKQYPQVNCNYLLRNEGEMFIGIKKETFGNIDEPQQNQSIPYFMYRDLQDRYEASVRENQSLREKLAKYVDDAVGKRVV